LTKKNSVDGREIQVISGPQKQTVFNQYEKREWKDYDLDSGYYLAEIYKEIRNIKNTKENQQLSLF
jgi:hypothetical protein